MPIVQADLVLILPPAALVVPESLRERAMVAQDGIEGASNLPNQLVLREFIDSGAYAAHLRHLRDVYRDRREALLDIVRPYLGNLFEPEVNPTGLRLVLRCSAPHALEFAMRLREEGVLCSTLCDLSVDGVADDGIVLGFAAFPPGGDASAGSIINVKSVGPELLAQDRV